MKNLIQTERLNAFVVNENLNKVVEKNVMAGEVVEKKPRLAKVVLRRSASPKLVVNVPLMSFVKNVGSRVAIMDIASGVVQLVDSCDIASLTVVKGDFKIAGITYGVKDTINGFNRYKKIK